MCLRRFWNAGTTRTSLPSETEDFGATDAPAGSRAKIDILAHRVLQGQPLWHPSDRSDYSGLTGAVRPRA